MKQRGLMVKDQGFQIGIISQKILIVISRMSIESYLFIQDAINSVLVDQFYPSNCIGEHADLYDTLETKSFLHSFLIGMWFPWIPSNGTPCSNTQIQHEYFKNISIFCITWAVKMMHSYNRWYFFFINTHTQTYKKKSCCCCGLLSC